MEKPIRIKVSSKTQCGDLFVFKEGKGMCQNGIVHIQQLGFTDSQSISFEIEKIPKIIEALKNLPTLTAKNQKTFMKDIHDYLDENEADSGYTDKFFED